MEPLHRACSRPIAEEGPLQSLLPPSPNTQWQDRECTVVCPRLLSQLKLVPPPPAPCVLLPSLHTTYGGCASPSPQPFYVAHLPWYSCMVTYNSCRGGRGWILRVLCLIKTTQKMKVFFSCFLPLQSLGTARPNVDIIAGPKESAFSFNRHCKVMGPKQWPSLSSLFLDGHTLSLILVDHSS